MQPNVSYLATELPFWLTAGFTLITVLTLLGFMLAVRRSVPNVTIPVLVGLLLWLVVLGVLAFKGFFMTLNTRPPRLFLALFPPILLILSLFISPGGRRFLRTLPLVMLTYLNMVRVLVEVVLYGLYIHHQVPQLMTFDGRNFDILAGLTAPVIAYFSFNRPILPSRWLLIWNVGALLLLLNIVVHAILSAPSPFQQLAFQQPNVGILKFPLIWLPGFVVPIILLGHLTAIWRLNTNRLRS